MIRALDLSHTFDYTLYDGISLEVLSKESVAILGISGSGKSTFLHNLSSFLKPTSGTVEIFGEDIYALNDKKIERLRRELLGLIFQQHYLFRGFSANDNLLLSSFLADKPIGVDLIKKLQIDHILTQNSADLSGGQQQRVSIARVLIKEPKIIFADELTGNLDKQTSENVMDIIFDYIDRVDGAMVLATHDEQLAQRCTKCFRIIEKRLVQIK